MDNSFELGGKNFKLSKINAFKQFHLVRRISPILAELLPVLQASGKDAGSFDSLSEDVKLEKLSKFVSPIMLGLGKLSDEDADKVLYALLSCVEVQQGPGGWAKVATESMLMMQDMELPVLLQLAGRAFMFNLSGFFAVAPRM